MDDTTAAKLLAEANFEGHDHRECGEHRTVGPHRAWCFNCQEWCYPEAPCARCELPAVRAELERLRKELSDTQRERAAGKLERIADWDEIGEYTRSVEAERDALKDRVAKLENGYPAEDDPAVVAACIGCPGCFTGGRCIDDQDEDDLETTGATDDR